MTNKQRTILFILIGTLVSVVITLVLIIALFVVAFYIFKDNPENVGKIFPFIFICGILLGMLIYQKLVNFAIKKFNLQDKLDPLFGPKRKSRLD